MNLQALLTNWHAMRVLRLGLGLFVAYQAIHLQDAIAGIVAGLFLFQAVTNTGCCGGGTCAIPESGDKKAEPREKVADNQN